VKKSLVIAIFILLSFLTPKAVFAQTCEATITNWDETNRQMQVCVGGFSSVDQLLGVRGELVCLGNSNLPNFSMCRDVQNNTFDASTKVARCNPGEPNCLIGQSENGLFTCFTIPEIPRAVGKAEVRFSGSATCNTSQQVTRPDNWNPGGEGLPWSDPSILPFCSVNQSSINTAIGCIPYTDTGALVGFFLRWGVGIGGGIALLLMLVAGYQIMTSSGDPKRLQAGKELMGAAISGITLLIFSVIIVRIIGVDILGIIPA
jgi:hypothetical protein